MKAELRVKGARVHNLKNIDLQFPRDALVVFTGLSGSGKSSLAFDTIFAEGQRRYVESLSTYARQFLGRMDRPEVDFIEGLSPAVAIDQKTTSRNPRSTVGTVTEIYDYLRLLWARVGIAHCPLCAEPVTRQTVQQIADHLLEIPAGTKFMLLAPVVSGKKGEFADLFETLSGGGFSRVLIDGQMHLLTDKPKLEKNLRHSIKVVVDRLVAGEDILERLTDSLETALKLADGAVEVQLMDDQQLLRFSEKLSCPNSHQLELTEIEPRTFSFNSPFGACPECSGLGVKMAVDEHMLIRDPSLTIKQGVIVPWSSSGVYRYYERLLLALGDQLGFDLDTPWQQLERSVQETILYGQNIDLQVNVRSRKKRWGYTGTYEGVAHNIERNWVESESDWQRQRWSEYLREVSCKACEGRRLKPASLAVKIEGQSIMDVCHISLRECEAFFQALKLPSKQLMRIAEPILREIKVRLEFLLEVGLGYLTLARSAATLSGGEAQRIRLATQIGSGLTGVLYVLDEPSIGLHQRDNQRLINTLLHLRDLGNTLIVVEHDEDTINAADWIVDVGPGAGINGGEIVYSGPSKKITACRESITGDYLSGKRGIPVPAKRREFDKTLTVFGAKENNLKDVTAVFPLQVMTAVTGVSGSGKSSLVNAVLYRALAGELNGSRQAAGRYTRIEGMQHLNKVVHVDQGPIGRTPRSNPATYTGVFDKIRTIFSQTPEAKARGYTPGRFSFNVKGGRCEVCAGDGTLKIEMNFLPDIYVDCEVCKGKRYNRDTLQITYKGKNIADILAMPVEEAAEFFASVPSIHNHLQLLVNVGLGYITLGQSATTLSGGEAQRVKLAAELQKRATGSTVYVLDEPTTGLHFEDVKRLLGVLHKLVDKGNTVIIIEHNLELIKTADWVIDIGPEGGSGGGEIIAAGTPEQVAQNPASVTGKFLATLLD